MEFSAPVVVVGLYDATLTYPPVRRRIIRIFFLNYLLRRFLSRFPFSPLSLVFRSNITTLIHQDFFRLVSSIPSPIWLDPRFVNLPTIRHCQQCF